MAGRILIVDGTATNRIVYKVKFGAAFYDTLIAVDGAGCLKLAREAVPDLILLDLALPDMAATEVLSRLRADPVTRAIPVMIVTSDCEEEERLAALAAGADDVMGKGTDTETLLARVRNLMRGREALTEMEGGGASLHALGFAEAAEGFAPAATVALVTLRPDTALRMRRELAREMPHRMLILSREDALSDAGATPPPDIYVIEAESEDRGAHLRLVSELRSKSLGRYSGICVVGAAGSRLDAAMGYDLGADDVVRSEGSMRELALRLRRILERKRHGDRLRASVRNGLRLAAIDPLTGLWNRRSGLGQLRDIAQGAVRHGTPYAVMVIDLDHFKAVNDTHGHPAGDAVLMEVAARLTANLRSADLLARIGGEEFLVALPDTDMACARAIAERLCRSVAERPIALTGGKSVRMTASVGLASGEQPGTAGTGSDAPAFDRADQALLSAKMNGRNRVTVGASGQQRNVLRYLSAS